MIARFTTLLPFGRFSAALYLAVCALFCLSAAWAQALEPLSYNRMFPVEILVDSKDSGLKQQITSSLIKKVESIDAAYVVVANPQWRIRVQAMTLPQVEGFGMPVVASVVVSMVSPIDRSSLLPRTASEKDITPEIIAFHYQLMRERGHVQEIADAIGDHLELQILAPFRRGTRDVLGLNSTEGKPTPRPKAPSTSAGTKATMQQYFTIGSTINEVVRIQGTPTSVKPLSMAGPMTYWWGLSHVEFVDDKVSAYDNSAGNLHVRLK